MAERISYKKEFVIAFIGAAAGSVLTLLIGGWNNLTEAKFKLLLDEVKDHTLDLNKESLVDSAGAQREYEIIINNMRTSYDELSIYKSSAKTLMSELQTNSGVDPIQLEAIVSPSVKTEVQNSLNQMVLTPNVKNCAWHPVRTHQSYACQGGKVAIGVCFTNKDLGCPGGTATGKDGTWVSAGAVQCCAIEYQIQPRS